MMQDDDEIRQLKRLRLRQREATEAIVGSSHLRDNLPDDLAEPLIHWALAQLNSDSLQTVAMDPATAETWFDARISAVADLARRLNRLVVDLPILPHAEAEQAVVAYLSSVYAVTGQPVDMERMADLVLGRDTRTVATTFTLLFDAIQPNQPAEEEE